MDAIKHKWIDEDSIMALIDYPIDRCATLRNSSSSCPVAMTLTDPTLPAQQDQVSMSQSNVERRLMVAAERTGKGSAHRDREVHF